MTRLKLPKGHNKRARVESLLFNRNIGDPVLHQFIDPFLQMIKQGVESWGYAGIVLMMAIESANIPLPSEAIMPTAGLLVQQGKMNIHLAALAGALGCLVGSVPSYFLGMIGGRAIFTKVWTLVSS